MSQLQHIAHWDEDYVADLQIGEPDWLDFKQSEWLSLNADCLDKLSKYVSAFANYEGGYLVIGVKDPRDGQPLEIDGGVSVKSKPKLKEWLEDKIPNLVDGRLEKIGVQLITPRGKDSKIKPDHCLVVIHVPESNLAPHQATDRKYYSRLGSKLEPIKHRAVLDILGRKKHPEVGLVMVKLNGDPSGKNCNVFVRLENIGPILARHFLVQLDVPLRVNGVDISFGNHHATFNLNQDAEGAFWRVPISNHHGRPLFPQDTIGTTVPFKFGPLPSSRPTKFLKAVRYKIFADEMPLKEGTLKLEDVIAHWPR